MSAAVKLMLPPDDYYAGVFVRAALHFFDLSIFEVSVVIVLLSVLAAYGVLFLLFARRSPDRAFLYAATIVLVMLAIYWLRFDNSIHASSRYYLRTALVLLTPMFGTLAALGAFVPRWTASRSNAEPGAGDNLATGRRHTAARRVIHTPDAGARRRDGEIRRRLAALSGRGGGSRDG